MRRCRRCCRASMPSSPAQDRYLQAQLARNRVELIRGRGVLLDDQSHRGAAAGRNALRAAGAAHTPRHRLAAAPCGRHRGGSRARARQRFDLELAVSAANADRARQRRDRLRVRLDLRGAGLRGHSARQGGRAAGLSWIPALRAGFLEAFRSMGGGYRGGAEVEGARFDGFSQVEVPLKGGDDLARRHRVRRVRPRRESGRHRSRSAEARDQCARPRAGR